MAHDPQGGAPAQAAGLTPRPEHARIAALFLRAVGVIHLLAFLSLLPQVLGLVGSHGILPAADMLQALAAATGPERFRRLPTLFWLDAGDVALVGACAAGALLGALLALGFAPFLLLVLLWALYLSLVNVGQVFLGYQWDGLLLETTLLALTLAPIGWRPGPREPPRSALLLLRFLLFRLMLASGLAKLLSGDPLWRGLLALRVHYETQPLPTWLGFYAHQLPADVQSACCLVILVIEIGVPFLAFAPRRLRKLAFLPLVLLQALIAATGNFAFFNLLTAALCLLLLDDATLKGRVDEGPLASPTPVRRAAATAAAALAIALSLVPFLAPLARLPWPGAALSAYEAVAPFRSLNVYGLFAVMTPDRPEIQVEGSRDGVEWRPYAFRYKPGDPKRAPGFVAPHQPRLDWQMWFAALRGHCGSEAWFQGFLDRLREGEPSVLALLAADPFAGRPPAFVRARLLDYRFSTLAERRRTGEYWQTADKGLYCEDLRQD